MPATAHYRLKQKDSEGHCRCSNHIGPGDLGWPNQAQAYTAKCSDGGWQRNGESQTVTVPAGTYHAETLAGANSLALADARLQAQALLDCEASMVFHRGQPRRVKEMADGKVLVLGNWNFLETLVGDVLSDDFLWPMLYRLNADGSFDDTFLGFSGLTLYDPDGVALSYAFGASEGQNQGYDFAFDSTGRIYVVGQFCFKVGGVLYNNIARFSAAGVFDPSFVCRLSSGGTLTGRLHSIQIPNDNSIILLGAFDNYAKGAGAFTQSISLVNIDAARNVVGSVPIGDVYHTLWTPFGSVYKLGRLYLCTNAPGFEFAGGSGRPPSALNIAGGGLVRVSLSSTGRTQGFKNCASIPYYGPDQGTRVLSIDMDRDGNLYMAGLFTAFGKVPLLGGVIPGSIGYTGDEVPRLNIVKTDATGTIDPNFKPPIVAAGDFPFGIEVIHVLPDRNIIVAGGAYYIDPDNPFYDQIVKLDYRTGRVLSTYPEMVGQIFGYPYALDATDAGLLYIAGIGGFVGPESTQGGAVHRFRW